MIASNVHQPLTSKVIDLLRFPLAAFVVVEHIFNFNDINIAGNIISVTNYPILNHTVTFVTAFFSTNSVPIFYFISGYLFFLGTDNFSKTVYRKKLQKRFHSLFIPYIVWNTLALILLLISSSPLFSAVYSNGAFTPSLRGLLSCYWSFDKSYLFQIPFAGNVSPVNAPLWFVRNLMVAVLLTPAIHCILKRLRYCAVIAMGAIWIAVSYSGVDPLRLANTLFFFSWGACLSINKVDFTESFGRVFSFSMVLYPLLALAYIVCSRISPQYAFFLKQANIIAGVLFACNLAAWLLKNNRCTVNTFLASSSFFIYVAHILICGKIQKGLLYILKPAGDAAITAIYTATILLTIFLLLAVFRFMKRFTPRLLRATTGRD